MKRIVLMILVFLGHFSFAQELVLSGKLRVLEPLSLSLKNINGETVFETVVKKDGAFKLGPKKIEPDLYLLYLGECCQPIYLENTTVTIQGFFNPANPESSSLNFKGIDAHYLLMQYVPQEANPSKRKIAPEVKNKLQGTLLSALAYLADIPLYEPNKFILDCMNEETKKSLSGLWLQHKVDSLYPYSLGAKAYDFKFQDPEGKEVRLSDFRGKFVLVDFWASWCGPCRQEMKSLLPIYNELKGDDLVFISVSLDNDEQAWRKMLDEEQLPWIMLWNKEGFPKTRREPNTIQRAYGFYSIPFIVLIDKEGNFIERDIRGEKVKEAILKARNKK